MKNCKAKGGRNERKAGVLIPEQFPHGGDRKARSYDATLKEVGITRDQSSRWQQEARVPDKEFERHIADTQDLAEILLYAEARLGEMLAATERNKGPKVSGRVR